MRPHPCPQRHSKQGLPVRNHLIVAWRARWRAAAFLVIGSALFWQHESCGYKVTRQRTLGGHLNTPLPSGLGSGCAVARVMSGSLARAGGGYEVGAVVRVEGETCAEGLPIARNPSPLRIVDPNTERILIWCARR